MTDLQLLLAKLPLWFTLLIRPFYHLCQWTQPELVIIPFHLSQADSLQVFPTGTLDIYVVLYRIRFSEEETDL